MRHTDSSRPSPYSALAEVYDRWMTHMDYDSIAERCRQLVAASGVARVLDLCTGTATVPLLLAREGIKVEAVDRSSQMLRIADQKIAQAGVQDLVNLREADVLTDQWPPGPFDLVLCTGDSMNYFDGSQLRYLLAETGNVLSEEGAVFFDLNSEHKLLEVLGNTTHAEDRIDFSYIWANHLGPDNATIDFAITLFTPDDDGVLWRRQVERHTQYLHRRDDVVELLQVNGFVGQQITEDFAGRDAVSVDALRWVFVAHR